METLPDPERLLAELADRMAGSIAADARLVGIYSGGAWLAERLAKMLPGEHRTGYIDVSFYRDDYSSRGLPSNVKRTDLPFDADGADIVLVDDVLYTGRSVRAALNELFDFGRPASVELAVLVDRGGRELPIEATYVGARLSIARDSTLVLARDEGGRLSLSLEPANAAEAGAGAASSRAADEEASGRAAGAASKPSAGGERSR